MLQWLGSVRESACERITFRTQVMTISLWRISGHGLSTDKNNGLTGTGTLASAHPSGALTHLELKFGPMLYIPTGHVLLAFWYGTPLVLPLADPFGVSYAPIVVPEVHHRATVIPRCSRPIRRQAPWLHSHTVVGHQQGSQRRIQFREAALIG